MPGITDCYMYRAVFKDGKDMILTSLHDVENLILQTVPEKGRLGEFEGDRGNGDDVYDFYRDILYRSGIRLSRSLAEEYEVIYELTELQDKRTSLFGSNIKVAVDTKKGPDVEELCYPVLRNGSYTAGTPKRFLRNVYEHMEDSSCEQNTRHIALLSDLADKVGSWTDVDIIRVRYEQHYSYYLADGDDYSYGLYKAFRWLLGKSGTHALHRRICVRRKAFQVSLPVDLLARCRENLGRDVTARSLEDLLEETLKKELSLP